LNDIFESNENDNLTNFQWKLLLKTFKNLSFKGRNHPSEIAILTHLLYSSLFYSHKKIKSNEKEYFNYNRKIYYSSFINNTLSDLNQACSSVIKFPSLSQFIFSLNKIPLQNQEKTLILISRYVAYTFFRFGLNYYKRSFELYNYILSSGRTNNEFINESNFNELTFLLSHNLQIYLYIIKKFLPGEIGIQSGIGSNIFRFYLYNIKSETQLDSKGATEIYSAIYTQRRGGIKLDFTNESLHKTFSSDKYISLFDLSINETIKIPKNFISIESKQILGKSI
ncbi:hypothetical protein, partial [Leptospira vanthielii]